MAMRGNLTPAGTTGAVAGDDRHHSDGGGGVSWYSNACSANAASCSTRSTFNEKPLEAISTIAMTTSDSHVGM
jgi:hypothetical protein